MTLTPNDLAIGGVALIAAIIMAAQDDPRWLRWIRRRWNRHRAWANFRRGREVPQRPEQCDRANNEYRVDRPTRSVP